MPSAPARSSKAEQERRRRAALAAGNAGAEAAAGGAAAGAQATVKAPTAAARATARAAVIAALVSYLTKLRERDTGWLSRELPKAAQVGKVNSADIAAVVAEERRRGELFAEQSVKRVTGALSTALAIPDAAQRDAAVRGIMEREQRYATQRSEAMAARAFAAVERVAVRYDSPDGGFWKLDPTVKEHTAGCLVMGGKFWPWAVLDKVHPPRHQGCPCRLLSKGQAMAEGLMRAGDVSNVRDAVRAASGVVMEASSADAILAELELRDRLAEGGLVSAEALASIPLAGES